MSPRPGSRTAPLADADDLRVEQIAAQLEEAEQQRLTDDWIERATLALTHDRPHNPTGRRRGGGAAMTDRGRASVRHNAGDRLSRRSKHHEHSRPRPASGHAGRVGGRLIAGDRVPEAASPLSRRRLSRRRDALNPRPADDAVTVSNRAS
jgi:hypothetical protein